VDKGKVGALRGFPQLLKPDPQNSRWPVAEASSNTNRPGTTPHPRVSPEGFYRLPKNLSFVPANSGRVHLNR
jgi:hypothetical protein